jgi:hypothetical protein
MRVDATRERRLLGLRMLIELCTRWAYSLVTAQHGHEKKEEFNSYASEKKIVVFVVQIHDIYNECRKVCV